MIQTIKQLKRLVAKEIEFQNIKSRKNEYDKDFNISCGKVMGLYKAITSLENTEVNCLTEINFKLRRN